MLTMFTPGVFMKSALSESPETRLIGILLQTGMNLWFLRVPLNLGELKNLGCRNWATWAMCSVLIKKDVTPWISALANSNNFKACVRYVLSNFFFHQMIALEKLWKVFFISSKKLFSFLRYSSFSICSLPFHTFQIQKDKCKWNNLWCHELTCINLQK